MPKKKRVKENSQISHGIQDENDTCSSKSEKSNITSAGFNLDRSNFDKWKTGVEEAFLMDIDTLELKKKTLLSTLDVCFITCLQTTPKSLLKTSIDMNDGRLKEIFINSTMHSNAPKSIPDLSHDQTYSKRRRTNSVTDDQLEGNKTIALERKRSCSLDIYKTPLSRVGLTDLTSAKKYTVSKPKRIENSGISFKRVMKPDEEAISTSGSPLLVHPNITTAPTVNIPLPGGVVMNIEPKKPRGCVTVPELDTRTKEQLKLLCQQLNTML